MPMYLHAIATAVPPAVFTQDQCYDMLAGSGVRARLSRRSQLTLQAVLRSESGITTRHFATTPVEKVFDFTADELNEVFRREAPVLGGRALVDALTKAGIRPDELDALVVCTCTGYLCPGVTSYMAEQLRLRDNTYLQDLVGLGCGAAIPALRAVEAVLATQPRAVVARVAVEICSAAFYLDDDPGVLISACLFSDGAVATIWRNTPGPGGLRVHGFNTLHLPAERDKLRFEMRDGKLRNRLHSAVPSLAAGAVTRLFAAEPPALPPLRRIIAHPGGRDVLDALEAALPGHTLDASRRVLRDHGNMSSPSVLFALEDALRDARPVPGEDWWLVSFGAGFSAHSCRLSAG